jgi:hypothetical protein
VPAAVRSYSTVAVANDGDAVFAKPAGLAVGDIMVAFVTAYGGWGYGTKPAGWSTVNQQANSSEAMGSYWKQADAEDVAAESFTWSGPGIQGGILYAIEGASGIEGYGSGPCNYGTASLAGFTPAASGDVLLVTEYSSASIATAATVNNNPSWSQDDADTSYACLSANSGVYEAAADTGYVQSGSCNYFAVVQYVAVAPTAHADTGAITIDVAEPGISVAVDLIEDPHVDISVDVQLPTAPALAVSGADTVQRHRAIWHAFRYTGQDSSDPLQVQPKRDWDDAHVIDDDSIPASAIIGGAGVGPTGPPGDPGEPGEPGATGAQGASGAPGATGASGAPGVGYTGATGPPGASGSQGNPGDPGDPGATGASGPTGSASTVPGPTGPAVTGASGTRGGIWFYSDGDLTSTDPDDWALTPDETPIVGDWCIDSSIETWEYLGANVWQDQGTFRGDPGTPGSAGATGASGPTGAASTVPGPTGPAVTGASGPTGPPSTIPGPSGPTGAAATGASGPTGPVSTVPGPTGASGPTGPAPSGTGIVVVNAGVPSTSLSADILRVQVGSTGAVAPSAWTIVPFDTKDWDPGTQFATGSHAWTVPADAGRFLIVGVLRISLTAGGHRVIVGWYLNASLSQYIGSMWAGDTNAYYIPFVLYADLSNYTGATASIRAYCETSTGTLLIDSLWGITRMP